MTIVKSTETRYPSLTRAVIRQTGKDSLEDIARHGADGGFTGLTYTRDTVDFFRRNRADILKLAEDMADDLGEDMLTMVSNFNCLSSGSYPNRKPDFTPSEIGAALFSNKGECCDLIQNAMAWFAAEEIAREMNPDI